MQYDNLKTFTPTIHVYFFTNPDKDSQYNSCNVRGCLSPKYKKKISSVAWNFAIATKICHHLIRVCKDVLSVARFLSLYNEKPWT